jgi:hypothetical protein
MNGRYHLGCRYKYKITMKFSFFSVTDGVVEH